MWLRRGLLGIGAVGLALAGVPATAAGPTRTFSAPMIVDKDPAESTGEPSIAVGPDGAVYIAAPDGPGVRTPAAAGAAGVGGSLLWRSDDGGAHWRFLGSYDVPTGGGDADVVAARDGRLYASGLSYAACSSVSASSDRGETWLPIPIAGCGQIPISNDREWQALDGNNSLLTVIGDTFGGTIEMIRSSLVNPVVLPSVQIPLSTGTDYQWPGTVAVDQRNGTAFTVWQTTGDPNDCDDTKCTAPASSKKPDRVMVSVLPRGATEAPAPIEVASRDYDTFDSFVADDVDQSGRVYVVWSERHPDEKQTWIALSSSSDGGHHWTTPVKVNTGPRTATFPWVSAGSDGRIAVSYYGTAAQAASPQKVTSGNGWQVYTAFSTDAGKTFAEYRESGDMNDGQICTSGTGCTDGGRNLLDFFETAVDTDGCLLTTFTDNSTKTPYISFVRQTGGPGLFSDKTCGDLAGAPAPSTTPVAAPAAHGKGTGGTLAATGLPLGLAAAGLCLTALGLALRRRN